MVGVEALTDEPFCAFAGESLGAAGALGFLTRGFFAGGKMGVVVFAELHCGDACDCCMAGVLPVCIFGILGAFWGF